MRVVRNDGMGELIFRKADSPRLYPTSAFLPAAAVPYWCPTCSTDKD
jgi:hypothetical protein